MQVTSLWLVLYFYLLFALASSQYFLSQTLNPGSAVIGATISPDKTKAAITAGTSIYVYSISASGLTLNQTISGVPNSMPQLTFSQDATFMAVGCNDYKTRIYRNPGTGSYSLFQTLTQALASIGSLALNGDSTVLVTASSDYKLRIYRRADNGTSQFSLFKTFADSSNSLMGTDISQNAAVVAAGGYDNMLRIYRLNNSNYTLSQTFRQATDVVYTVSISRDGTLIAACSLDTNVRLYRLNATTNLFYLAQTIRDVAQVVGVRISPDKNRIVFGGTGSYISVYQLTSGIYTILQKLSISVTTQYCMGWQSDHSMFISGGADGRLRVYQLCSKYFDNCPNCTNKDYCSCPSTSYINSAGSCVSCSANCTSCNSSGCKACASGYYLDTYDYQCYTCQYGYGQGCTSCTGGGYFDNCTAVLPGYYISWGFPYSCSSSCATCSAYSTCTSCPSGYVLSGSRCSVSSCTNATLTNCSSCSGGTCNQCFSGFYLASSVCQTCSSALTHCATCSNSTNCTLCDTGYVLKNDRTCGVCSDTLGAACLSCTSSSVCTSCNATSGYQLSGNNCTCGYGFYSDARTGTCSSCVSAMDACGTCQSATKCLTCPSLKYTLAADSSNCVLCMSVLTSCIQCDSLSECTLCDSGFFLRAATKTCSACSVQCGECDKVATNCTICAYGYTRSGSVCQRCNVTLSNCDSCTSTTSCSSCSSGFIYNSTTSVCDTCSIYMANCTRCLSPTECTACQPGLYLDFSGVCTSCPADCPQCSSPTNCTSCIAGLSLSNGACTDPNAIPTPTPTPPQPLPTPPQPTPDPDPAPVIQSSMTLVSLVKSPSSNVVTCVISLSPKSTMLDALRSSEAIAQHLKIGPANLSVSPVYSYNNATGELTAVLAYNSPIQDENISVTLVDAAGIPVSSSYFVCDPDNNLAAVVVDDSTYSSVGGLTTFSTILGYLSLGGLCFSLFTNKFIGIQMIGVFQIAFLGLMSINQLPPLLQPIAAVGISNGPNDLLKQEKSAWIADRVPKRISALNFQATFLYSFNYTYIALVTPLLASGVCLLLSKLWKSKQAQLQGVVYFAACPCLLTSVLFCISQSSSAFAVFLAYGSSSSSKVVASNAAGVAVVLAIISGSLFLYCKKQLAEKFQQYKSGFKNDWLSQHMYVFLSFIRLIECFCMVLTKESVGGMVVATLIPLAVLVLVLIKRPYLHMYNNLRACCNQAVVFGIMASYCYYKATVPSSRGSLQSVLPVLEVTALTGVLVGNLVCMVKSCLDSKNSQKVQKQQVKETQDSKLKEEAVRTHIMRKSSLQLSLNQRALNNTTKLRQEAYESGRDNFLNDLSKLRLNKSFREQDIEFYNQI